MQRSVLAVGAHPDDIELGCAGTLLRHLTAGDRVGVLVLSDGAAGPGTVVDRAGEQAHACDVLGISPADRFWGGLPDGRLSEHEFDVVRLIEAAARGIGADRIYTHSPHDSHQDHRTVAQCTLGAARKLSDVLGYESPSAVGFLPTVYVDISDALDKKLDAVRCHTSQVVGSDMVDEQRIRTTAEHHGYVCRRAYAEAFEPARLVLGV